MGLHLHTYTAMEENTKRTFVCLYEEDRHNKNLFQI